MDRVFFTAVHTYVAPQERKTFRNHLAGNKNHWRGFKTLRRPDGVVFVDDKSEKSTSEQ